jgi:hypothetical protein
VKGLRVWVCAFVYDGVHEELEQVLTAVAVTRSKCARHTALRGSLSSFLPTFLVSGQGFFPIH